jgi:hypothetical protein
MCAPKSPKEFKKMINWVSDQLDDGKKIHIGCIGGHGRTGTFLAALVSLYEDLTDDPISWVREHHCAKAVESKAQIKFLVKHFNCKTAKPTKDFGVHTGRLTGKRLPNWEEIPKVAYLDRKKAPEKIKAMRDKKGSIWG